MTLEQKSNKILYLFLAIALNAFVLFAVSALSVKSAGPRESRFFNSIKLAVHEPTPVTENEPKTKRPEPKEELFKVKPKVPPENVKPKIVKPRATPEIPKAEFEMSPQLSMNMDVPMPTPEPVVEPNPVPEPQQVVTAKAMPSEFQVGDVDQVPRIIQKVEPVYPHRAQRRNITGEVTVKFLVAKTGHVEKLSIVKAEPSGIFENSVQQAVRKWVFTPGYYKGNAVATWVVLPIRFNLSS